MEISSAPIPKEQTKIFAPVGGGAGRTSLTFLYFFLLANLMTITSIVASGDSDVVGLFLDYLGEGGILYVSVLPLILALLIHKPLEIAVYAALLCFIIFWVLMLPRLKGDDLGYFILGFLGVLLYFTVMSGIGLLLRGFYRLPSAARISIAVVPFLILAGVFVYQFQTRDGSTITDTGQSSEVPSDAELLIPNNPDRSPDQPEDIDQARVMWMWECSGNVYKEREVCLARYVKQGADALGCNQIDDNVFRAHCFAVFAFIRNDVGLCDLATPSSSANPSKMCREFVADFSAQGVDL